MLLLLACLPCISTVPVMAEDEPAELMQARSSYQKDVEFATRPIRDRYLSRLNALKRLVGGRGDVRSAVAVQEEIDRVNSSIPDPGFEKFAGSWSVTYTTGETRHYVISQDGIVTWDETGGKKIAPVKAKLSLKGNEAVFDYIQGAIEVFKLSGKNLSIDVFNPRQSYPKGKPFTTATAVPPLAKKD